MNWDELFIRQAMLVSEKSKDPSTKVGCVLVGEGNIVLSMGFNGFPRGVNEHDASRWERPGKYNWVEHAERNAVFNAARHGIKLLDARAYLNWGGCPCSDCARALIQAGVKEIIGPDIPFPGVGAGVHYHLNESMIMLKESNVLLRTVEWTKNTDRNDFNRKTETKERPQN